MTGRRGLLGLLLALAAGPLAAQEAPVPEVAPAAPPRPRPRRRAARRRRPAEPAPSPTGEAFTVPAPGAAPPAAAGPAEPRWEPAPLPDRDLEAPRARADREGPTLSPDLLTPRGTHRGQSFEGDQMPRQDRLFLQPAPGATLRVPFSY